MPTESINSKIEDVGAVDPKEASKIEASLKGREQAPRVIDQTGSWVNWTNVRDQLGQNFDVERIPLRKLRQMRRDPMIAFGLHYRKVPLAQAEWHIEAADKTGPNPQVSAFMTNAWRQVHARFIFQRTQDFDFGWQAIAQRFALGNPGGYYIDPAETNVDNRVKPVWDEGTVRPIIWKPFVALPPEQVAPVFNTNGDFDGMIYDKAATQTAPINVNPTKLTKDQMRIDVYHSLWGTNDRDSAFGSLYGYPLISHAYRYWWSYWFRWAMADRAFERQALPPLVAYHPDGSYIDPDTGQEVSYQEVSQVTAESLRANAIATVPGTLASAGMDERGTSIREWEFKFMDVPSSNFDALDKSFNYLDVMKLRSICVPENALIEGSGGTSSRNVAEQMADLMIQSEANKWEEISFDINDYILPKLLAVNFPEFVNNGGTCRIVGHGFKQQDIELMKQLIQLIGQGDPTLLGIDTREMLERLNMPILSPEALQRQQELIALRQAMQQTPQVNGGRGQLNVAPANTAGLPPGNTNGGSVPEPNAPGASTTGFSDDSMVFFVPETISLSDSEDFLSSLPNTRHYDDKTTKALALQLRKLHQAYLREIYKDFAKYVGGIQTIVLTDEPNVELADRSKVVNINAAKKAANKLLDGWAENSKRLQRLTDSSQNIITRLVKRSVDRTKRDFNITAEIVADRYQAWIEQQTGKLIKSVHGTVRDELQQFLVNQIRDGKTSSEIALEIQQHFDGFDEYKSNRIARSEVRDAMNAGTLIASEEGGHKYVQATDGTEFDVECRNRNEKIFTLKEAWREMTSSRTHPNCTLGFRPLARAEFAVKSVDELPAEAGNADAWFDDETCTAYIPLTLSDNDAQEFLKLVANHING